MFSLDIQKKIKEDIDLLLCFIKTGIINSGFAQRVEEQRLSQEIETYIKYEINSTFENKKFEFKYLARIDENNGSTKAPYELLFVFEIDNIDYDVYVDFKPINILKEQTSPFMGSINKYIQRLQENKFYDIFLIVEYESEVNKLPMLKKIKLEFVKDIKNYSLYNNWQLQLSIKSTKVEFGRHPNKFKEDLIKLLNEMKTTTLNKIERKCDDNINVLNNIEL